MKSKLYIITICIVTAVVLSAGTLAMNKPTQTLEKRANLVMREIGHKLLLHAGDSTSRVLPVRKLSDNTYQLEFQSRFTFISDSLVAIVNRSLNSSKLPLDYMATVIDCGSKDIIFGYEMNTKRPNVIACIGRTQPLGCYKIQIEFTDLSPDTSLINPYLIIGLLCITILFMPFLGRKYLPKENPHTPLMEENFISIGAYVFYTDKKILKNKAEVTELSEKEAKLLNIFATNQNQVIERDRLLKEVWEDEGVFVIGRSLDVFVSKLRKKLQSDASIKISNIHGKGYKLEVG